MRSEKIGLTTELITTKIKVSRDTILLKIITLKK
jgi:hypothetical protein